MTKAELLHIIENPEVLGTNQTSVLKDLKEQFPYSSTVQMLFAKALHTEGSIYYENQLKQTSLVTPDRRKLYQLIMQAPLQEKIKQFEEEVEESVDSESSLVTEDETPVKEIKADQLDALEQNILVAAVNSSIHSELLDYEQAKEEETTTQEPTIDESTPLEEQDSEQDSAPTPSFDASQKHGFSAWLNFSKEDAKEAQKRGEIGRLIDQFIDQKSEQEKTPSTFFSASNLAKISLIDKEEFVTETLAKIYADQGNYEKAINAYRQLSLKFPEKSAFFAGLIKKLEQKLKSK